MTSPRRFLYLHWRKQHFKSKLNASLHFCSIEQSKQTKQIQNKKYKWTSITFERNMGHKKKTTHGKAPVTTKKKPIPVPARVRHTHAPYHTYTCITYNIHTILSACQDHHSTTTIYIAHFGWMSSPSFQWNQSHFLKQCSQCSQCSIHRRIWPFENEIYNDSIRWMWNVVLIHILPKLSPRLLLKDLPLTLITSINKEFNALLIFLHRQ